MLFNSIEYFLFLPRVLSLFKKGYFKNYPLNTGKIKAFSEKNLISKRPVFGHYAHARVPVPPHRQPVRADARVVGAAKKGGRPGD